MIGGAGLLRPSHLIIPNLHPRRQRRLHRRTRAHKRHATYVQNVSRAAVDAGADVVLVHGPHHLRGVEVYAGKPIFYGLGSLTYSLGLHYAGYDLPIEWDDGVVAVTRFEEGRLVGVELHPLVHGQLANDTESSGESALPKVAPPAEAGRILEHLRRVSEPFGTGIEVREGVGYVELGL